MLNYVSQEVGNFLSPGPTQRQQLSTSLGLWATAVSMGVKYAAPKTQRRTDGLLPFPWWEVQSVIICLCFGGDILSHCETLDPYKFYRVEDS